MHRRLRSVHARAYDEVVEVSIEEAPVPHRAFSFFETILRLVFFLWSSASPSLTHTGDLREVLRAALCRYRSPECAELRGRRALDQIVGQCVDRLEKFSRPGLNT